MSYKLPPRLIDEICAVGKLDNHRIPLTDLITRMVVDGLRVSTRYDVDYSSILNNRVRVTLVGIIDPLDIIWELMHEYGHYLSGERQPGDTDLQREQLAWIYADRLLCSFPDLLPYIELYNTCKQRCLESYQLLDTRQHDKHNS